MSEIDTFLVQVKSAIDNDNYKVLEFRRKYLQTLASLGITKDDVIEDIYNLTSNEAWTTEPDDNPNYPGNVWITKKTLHGSSIYLKLKIDNSNGDSLLVISYHIDRL